MSEPERDGLVEADGGFRYCEHEDCAAVWATAADLAQDWWADCVTRNGNGDEYRTHAIPFVNALLQQGHPAAIDVLQALVDAATSDGELDFVGASALEDLLCHNHHGVRFVDEVELRARQQPRFRTALAGVWLPRDVAEQVRQRLGHLGAKLI